MIPVKLTLRGLYSYRLTQTIDFTNLTNAGLFGLFGGVGSGKSTLLEAISFALYGESERLNTRDNRNYNMMNLKSNDLLIDFEFKTGHSEHYRFVVTGKRNSKRFDEVKSFERAAYRRKKGQWEPLENTTAEEITGLTYNNFKRTIIIPQGKFQEFLQLSAKDRTEMLKELFSLERFELSGKVIALENRNNETLQHLRGQLQSVAEITPQQLTELQQTSVAQQQELQKLTTEMSQLQTQVQNHNQTKALLLRQTTLASELANLLGQENTINALNHELTEYEQLMLTFQSDVDQLKSLQANISRLQTELATTKSKQDETLRLIDQVRQQMNVLQPQYDKRDEMTRRADELTKLLDIRDNKEKLKDLHQRSAKGKTALADKTNELEELKNSHTQLKTQHDATRATMPDMALLAKVKEWFTISRNQHTTLADTKQRMAEVNTSIEEVQKRSLELMLSQAFEGTPIDAQTPMAEYALCIETEKQRIAHQQQQNNDIQAHLKVQQRLNEYALELHEGKACPLCGSTHHPHIPDAKDVTAHLAAIKKECDDVDKRIKTLNDLEKQLAQHSATVMAMQKQRDSYALQIDALQKDIAKHCATHSWPNFPIENEAAVNEAFATAETLKTRLDTQSAQLAETTLRIDKTEKEKEKFAIALQAFEHKQVELTSKIDTLTAQLTIVQPALMDKMSNEALTNEVATLQKQHADLINQYQTTDKQQHELNQTLSTLNGLYQGIADNLATTEATHKQVLARIDTKRAEAGNLTLAHIEAVMQKQFDIVATRQRITNWQNEVIKRRELIKQTETEMDGRTYNAETHETAQQQLDANKRKLETLNQEIGTISSQIKRLETDLAKQTELRKQLDHLELRAADLTELKNLFRGSGFVNYISTVYLQNLCAMANERFFHLTRQHLSLELADDNAFMVRDYMNEGKLRSVKTLSGGQTFQASLSLALALADSIRHLSSGHENFFFLDEGFGTLDKESLSTVFDTLKSLRKENRIVGVISHVEEMQQEIETYLMITNHEETGSIISESWK